MEKRLTTTSTVTSKYQTVIPRQIRKELGLKVNQQLMWSTYQTKGGPVSVITPKPKRWSEYLRGLGKGLWEGVDVVEYLRDLRSE